MTKETAEKTSHTATRGKRERVICGKVSQELYEGVKKLIDGREFNSMNDVVETAVWHFVTERQNNEGIEGGVSVGN